MLLWVFRNTACKLFSITSVKITGFLHHLLLLCSGYLSSCLNFFSWTMSSLRTGVRSDSLSCSFIQSPNICWSPTMCQGPSTWPYTWYGSVDEWLMNERRGLLLSDEVTKSPFYWTALSARPVLLKLQWAHYPPENLLGLRFCFIKSGVGFEILHS